MNAKSLLRFTERAGTRTTFAIALAAFLLAGFSFAESGSAAPLAWDYTTVLTVGSRIGIGTETPDANTVIEARRSDTTDTMIKSRHLTKGAYFQTQSGINWAGYNMLNAAGATATYFGYRGSTQFRIYDSLAAEDRLLMDAAGTDNGNIYLNPTNTGGVGIGTTTLSGRLDVETASGAAIYARNTATAGTLSAIYGQTDSYQGHGVAGHASSTIGEAYGIYGTSASVSGAGVYGEDEADYGVGVMGQGPSVGGAGVAGYITSTNGAALYGINFATTGPSAHAVEAVSYSTSGSAIHGLANVTTGPAAGVHGETFASIGRGVWGSASASTGANYGVYGSSASTSGGYGVLGDATGTTGPNRGVFGSSSSPEGTGVYGYTSATTGNSYGVQAVSQSTVGRGLYALAAATTGYNVGVEAVSYSTAGRGVYAKAMGTSGAAIGVNATSDSPSGYGVLATAAATSGTNYGVFAQTSSPDGYGVYSAGDLHVTGDFTLSGGTKAAIVETEDYGWRSLYAVESPQNWFEDFGQGILTAGEAVVTIEPIFAETVNLTGSYHVFLTPQDGYCGLYVTEKTSSTFTVRAVEGASCEISFDYRIIAPRLDYDDLRLEPARDPEAIAAAALAAISETE